ncbi:serine hydrolase [Massilia sp.]|uniref:serine hydrolase n=1 Tax=Massilia sp. TaxID=1882437 RepID=UPI00289698FC|nr:serine hydrolase [Massilia sp.]
MIKKLFATALMSFSAAAFAVPFGSQSVLVVDDETGKVLIEKNADTVVPIASLTKLMTAMVVLDAKLDMDEQIEIDRSDVDTVKFSSSRVPVGASIARRDVLHLALMSSDNRAAAALARTYPGGKEGFKAAVRRKIHALGMTQTSIEEPTGLSPHNRSTAVDLVKMATASTKYPEIVRMTTETRDIIDINGRGVEYRNTNRLVGAKGWDVGLSKTGFTNEAGRCLIMNIKAAGKNATLVLLNAGASSARIMDALNIRRFIAGDEPVARVARAATGGSLIKASAGRSKSKASARAKAGAKAKAVSKRKQAKVKTTRKRRD